MAKYTLDEARQRLHTLGYTPPEQKTPSAAPFTPPPVTTGPMTTEDARRESMAEKQRGVQERWSANEDARIRTIDETKAELAGMWRNEGYLTDSLSIAAHERRKAELENQLAGPAGVNRPRFDGDERRENERNERNERIVAGLGTDAAREEQFGRRQPSNAAAPTESPSLTGDEATDILLETAGVALPDTASVYYGPARDTELERLVQESYRAQAAAKEAEENAARYQADINAMNAGTYQANLNPAAPVMQNPGWQSPVAPAFPNFQVAPPTYQTMGQGGRNLAYATAVNNRDEELARAEEERAKADAALAAIEALEVKVPASAPTEGDSKPVEWGKLLLSKGRRGLTAADQKVAKGIDWLIGDFLDEVHILAGTTIQAFNPNYDFDERNWLTRYIEEGSRRMAVQAANAENAANGNETALKIGGYAEMIAQSAPTAVLALMSLPASAAGATTETLQTVAALAQSSKAAQYVQPIATAVMGMMKNPQWMQSFVSNVGVSYEEALADGASVEDASLYAVTNAAFSATVEVGGSDELLGGIQSLPANYRDAMASGSRAAALKVLGGNIGSEISEELTQGVGGTALKNIYRSIPLFWTDAADGEEAVIDPARMAEEAKGAAVVSAFLGGGQMAAQNIANAVLEKGDPAMNAVLETAGIETETEAETATAPATPEQIVADILSKPVTNSQANRIINDPELLAAFEAKHGKLPAENSKKRAAIKSAAETAAETAAEAPETPGDIKTAPPAAEADTAAQDVLNNDSGSGEQPGTTRVRPTLRQPGVSRVTPKPRQADAGAEPTVVDAAAEVAMGNQPETPAEAPPATDPRDILVETAMGGETQTATEAPTQPAPNPMAEEYRRRAEVARNAGDMRTAAEYERRAAEAETAAASPVQTASVPPRAGGLAPTQTHSSDPLYTNDEREIAGLRPEDSVHERHTDQAVDEAADRRYNADAAGEKADLFDSGEAWTDADTVLAHRFLAEAVEEARRTGDYSEVVRLQREWERQGTAEGQALRQRGRFANTPEAIIAEAAAVIYDPEKTRKKLRPKQRAGIMETVVDFANKYNGIPDGDTASIIALIKQASETRRTTGLFSKETSRTMEWALERAAAMPDGESFLRNVLAAQIRNIAGDYARPSIINQVQQVRFLNMLSKLSTVSRNLVGNNVLDAMEVFANNQAVIFDKLLSTLTGRRSIAWDKGVFSGAKASGASEGFIKSFIQEALDAHVEDVDTKYEQRTGRTFKMSGNFIERFLSTWEKYENFALKTTDETKKGGIRAETQRGLNDLAAKGLVSQEDVEGLADTTALERTLQRNGNAVKAIGGLRNAANALLGYTDSHGETIGLGSGTMPFVGVAANATVKAVQYTPAGALDTARQLGKTLLAAHNGELTAQQQADFVMSVGRTLTGVELLGVSIWAALSGIISTAGDEDKDKAASERASGERGTQINLSALFRKLNGEDTAWQEDDIVMEVGFLEQANANFAMGQAIAEAYLADGTISPRDVANANAEAVMRAVLELPALSQFADMADAYNYSKAGDTFGRVIDAAGGLGTSIATSYVVPNAVRGLAASSDEYTRDLYSADTQAGKSWDYLKAGVPGLRESLPVAVDSWGREMSNTTGSPVLDFLNNNVLPGRVTRYHTDEMRDNLAYLSDLGVEGIYPDRNAPSSVKVDGEKFALDADAKRQYQRTAGSMTEEVYAALMGSELWESMPPEIQGEALRDAQAMAEAAATKEFLTAQGVTGKALETDYDTELSLSDPVEYLANKAMMADASKGESRDYSVIDGLIADWTGLNPDTQEALLGDFNMIDELVAAAENNVGAEAWFAADDAIAQLAEERGTSASTVKLEAILSADLSPAEEAYLVSTMASKNVADTYAAFTGLGLSGDEALKFFLSADGSAGSKANNSLSQAEVYKALANVPTEYREAIWNSFGWPKSYSQYRP